MKSFTRTLLNPYLLLSMVLLTTVAGPLSAASVSETALWTSIPARDWRQPFGQNLDMDIAAAEDVWTAGGACVFPAAAATTTIVSSDAKDTSDGVGCRTATVTCLDDDLAVVSQSVILAGATPVELTTDCRKDVVAECATAGSELTNAGTLSLKHTTTVIGHVAIAQGNSLSACKTIPAGITGQLSGWHCSLNLAVEGTVVFSLETKAPTGLWNVLETYDANSLSGGYFFRKFSGYHELVAGTDIRVRGHATADDMGASCGFDVMFNTAQ